MPTILGAAASGMSHNQQVLDVVGHNLANVNSAAFKKVRPMAEGVPDPTQTPTSTRLGVAQTTKDFIFQVGIQERTEQPLHFAINDDAFFQVQDFDGSTVFTRFGALGVDADGNVTAFRGRFLEPPVTVPDGLVDTRIDAAGVITAADETGSRQEIGRISLFRFGNPQGLEALGDGLFRETANSGEVVAGEPGDGTFQPIAVGAIEGSNVNMAEEFTNMLIAQRAYQACAKTFSIGDQMLQLATNLTQ